MAANQWVLLLALTIILGLFTGLMNERFFNPRNLISILEQSSVLGLVAAGATMLIISGNFDISVGAIIGLCCSGHGHDRHRRLPRGTGHARRGCSWPSCAASSTLPSSRLFQAPTFIVSLATIGIFTGLALWLTVGAHPARAATTSPSWPALALAAISRSSSWSASGAT